MMDLLEKEGSSGIGQDGATRALARFVANLRDEQIDAVAAHTARRHLVDTLGACIAGASQELTTITRRVFARSGNSGNVSVPGLRGSYALLDAAYLAGASTHGLELDDGYRAGSLHPGSVVMPVVMALGASRDITGADALRAIVAGYEVSCRIGAATHPRTRWRGFHNTGCAGIFGAAAAAGVILGFDADQVENAMGIAASFAGGLFTFLAGGDVKRLHPAHAAREGLLAALMTLEGLAGPKGALEYRDGYFHAYSGEIPQLAGGSADILAMGGPSPGSLYAVAGCYMKPYACCRHLHPALDAVLDIVRTENIPAEQVRRVDVGTYAVAASHAGAGWSEMTTAQMSFEFCIGTAIVRRRVTLSDFFQAERGDAAVHRIAHGVSVHTDPECDAEYPLHAPAKVRLETADGRILERHVVEPLGSALNPLSDQAVGEKFLALTGRALGDKRAEAALAALWDIGGVASMAALVQSLLPGEGG